MTTAFTTIIITFLASFIQGVTGFGFALIAMPILSGLTSIYVAAPLVALITLTNNTMLGIYYRRSFDRKIVGQLLLGSVLGIPFGFLVLQFMPTAWLLTALGVLIVAYALYALIGPAIPSLQAKAWIYGTGFASGILFGSYNLPGPPVVLYGNSQHWPQEKFKSNLISFFWINAVLVVNFEHAASSCAVGPLGDDGGVLFKESKGFIALMGCDRLGHVPLGYIQQKVRSHLHLLA